MNPLPPLAPLPPAPRDQRKVDADHLKLLSIFHFICSGLALLGVLFLLSCVLNLISGLCLATRTGRTFSLVVAGLNCVHVPIGTTLGVFTFVVLLRDSVRELYETKSNI